MFGGFGVHSFLSCAAEKQTDTQTDADERFTPATLDRVSNEQCPFLKALQASNIGFEIKKKQLTLLSGIWVRYGVPSFVK